MKKFIMTILILSVGGCSVFVPWTQRVTIIPSDPTAEVFVENRSVGTGTVQVDLMRNRSYAVSARVGDRMATATLNHQISATGVLDVVGGILFGVPFVGCFFPGFWDLSPGEVHVQLPS